MQASNKSNGLSFLVNQHKELANLFHQYASNTKSGGSWTNMGAGAGTGSGSGSVSGTGIGAAGSSTMAGASGSTMGSGSSGSIDSHPKKKCIDSIIEFLSRHTHAEETILYPMMKNKLEDGNFIYQRFLLDHASAKQTMIFLMNNYNHIHSEMYDLTVKRLSIEVQEHVALEEVVLPKLQQKMTDKEIMQLHIDLLKAEKDAPAFPSVSGPMGVIGKVAGKVSHMFGASGESAIQKEIEQQLYVQQQQQQQHQLGAGAGVGAGIVGK